MRKWIGVLTFGIFTGFFFVFGSGSVLAEDAAKASAQKVTAAPETAAPEEGRVTEETPPAEAPKAALTPEKMTSIRQAAEKLIQEEIESAGSFEVDHPETGDLLNLSLDSVQPEVSQSDEGEYLLKASFKDKAGVPYKVGVYLEELGNGEYELADAIIEEMNGKPVSDV